MLRRGYDVDIDHFTIMYTDLGGGGGGVVRKDLRLPGYYLVRQHFAVLEKAVRENNGAIVKTIGDAIMASFSNPLDGLNCGIQIYRDFETFNANSGWTPVTIRSVFASGAVSR